MDPLHERPENFEASEKTKKMDDLESDCAREEDGKEAILGGSSLRDVNMVLPVELEDGKESEGPLVCNGTHSENDRGHEESHPCHQSHTADAEKTDFLGDQTQSVNEGRKEEFLCGGQARSKDEEKKEESLLTDQIHSDNERMKQKSLLGDQNCCEDEAFLLKNPTCSEDEERRDDSLHGDLTCIEDGEKKKESLLGDHTYVKDEERNNGFLLTSNHDEERKCNSLAEFQTGYGDEERKIESLRVSQTVMEEYDGSTGAISLINHGEPTACSENEQKEEEYNRGQIELGNEREKEESQHGQISSESEQWNEESKHGEENNYRNDQVEEYDGNSVGTSLIHGGPTACSGNEQMEEEYIHGQIELGNEQEKEESQHGKTGSKSEQWNEESKHGEENNYGNDKVKEINVHLNLDKVQPGPENEHKAEKYPSTEDIEHAVPEKKLKEDAFELVEQTTTYGNEPRDGESSAREKHEGIKAEKKLLMPNQVENSVMSSSEQGDLNLTKPKGSENESLSLLQKPKNKRIVEESLVIGRKKQKVSETGEMDESKKENPLGLTVVQEKGKQQLSEMSIVQKSGVSSLNHPISSLDRGKMLSKFTSDAERKLDGIRYRLGDMVWAKVKSHPWWPGQLYDPDLASSIVIDFKRESCFLVAFFGDSTFGWFSESEVIPFEPNFPQKCKQTSESNFVDAVEDALDELYRRVKSGLTCKCHRKADIHARNRHGKPRLLYDRQLREARNAFDPAKLMAFIRQISCSPFCSSKKMLLTTIGGAQAHAFRIFSFTDQTSEYKDVFKDLNDEAVSDFKMEDDDEGKASMKMSTKGSKGSRKNIKIKQQDTSSIVYGTGKIKKRNVEKKKARDEGVVITKKSNIKVEYPTPLPDSLPSHVSHNVPSDIFQGESDNKCNHHTNMQECDMIMESQIDDVLAEIKPVEAAEKDQGISRKLTSSKRRRMDMENDLTLCISAQKSGEDQGIEISTVSPQKRRKSKSMAAVLRADLTDISKEGNRRKRKPSAGILEKNETLKSDYNLESLKPKAAMETLRGESLTGSFKEDRKHIKENETVRSLSSYTTSYKEESSNPIRNQTVGISTAVNPEFFQRTTQFEATQFNLGGKDVVPMIDENVLVSIEANAAACPADDEVKETNKEKDTTKIYAEEPCKPMNLAVATSSGTCSTINNSASEDVKAEGQGNVSKCLHGTLDLGESSSVGAHPSTVNQNFCDIDYQVSHHEEAPKKPTFERSSPSSENMNTSKDREVDEDVLKDTKVKNRPIIDDKLQTQAFVQKSKKGSKEFKNKKSKLETHLNVVNLKPTQGIPQKKGETTKAVKARRFEKYVDIDNAKLLSQQDFALKVPITATPLADGIEIDDSEHRADPAMAQKGGERNLEETNPQVSASTKDDRFSGPWEARSEKISLQRRESTENRLSSVHKPHDKMLSSKKVSPSIVSLRPAIDADVSPHGSKGILNRFGQRIHTPRQASELDRTRNVSRGKNMPQEWVIMINFPSGFPLPSEQKVKEALLTLRPKTIRMDIANGYGQILYGDAESAEEAMRILQSSSDYKSAHISLRTKDISSAELQLDKKESEPMVNPDMLSMNASLSNEGVLSYRNDGSSNKCTGIKPQKSCLRKANDPPFSGRNAARVTFQLKGAKMIGQSREKFAISEAALKSGIESSGYSMRDREFSDSSDISDRFMTLLHQVHHLVSTSGFVL